MSRHCMELVNQIEQRQLQVKRTKKQSLDYTKFEQLFLYPAKEIMQKTLENTTLYGSINKRVPMQQHYKSRNPILQRRCINEGYATDTWFSSVTSYEGF